MPETPSGYRRNEAGRGEGRGTTKSGGLVEKEKEAAGGKADGPGIYHFVAEVP